MNKMFLKHQLKIDGILKFFVLFYLFKRSLKHNNENQDGKGYLSVYYTSRNHSLLFSWLLSLWYCVSLEANKVLINHCVRQHKKCLRKRKKVI